jgi:hypothetical protein
MAFSNSTSRSDILTLDSATTASLPTYPSLCANADSPRSLSVSTAIADLVRTARSDLSLLGFVLSAASFSPFSANLTFPLEPNSGSATWSIAKRRRRVISLSHARELALTALYNAEATRMRAAEEEARRTSAYEALA